MFRVVLWSWGCLSLPPSWGGITGGIHCPCDTPSNAKVSFFDNLQKKNLTAAEVLRKIFRFLYLSLKFSLTLPHKGKMLWCSYFLSFIKSIIFSRCRNFIKKLNLLVPLGKLYYPEGIVQGSIYGSYKSIWVGNDFFTPK